MMIKYLSLVQIFLLAPNQYFSIYHAQNCIKHFPYVTLTFYIIIIRQLFSSKFTIVKHARIYKILSFTVTFVPQNNIMESVLFQLYTWENMSLSLSLRSHSKQRSKPLNPCLQIPSPHRIQSYC